MGWLFVIAAATLEMVGVVGMRLFNENKTARNLLTYVSGFIFSFGLLYTSFQYLDMSIAYAVWTGLGTAGAVLVNMIFFGESRSFRRIGNLGIIIVGVVGHKIIS